MTTTPQLVMAAHRLVHKDGELTALCTCGWESEPARSRDGKHLMHEAHVLAVLSEKHAVVELPEVDGEDDDGQVWMIDDGLRIDLTGRAGPTIIDTENKRTLCVSELRSRAAGFLAAIRVAEGGGSRG